MPSWTNHFRIADRLLDKTENLNLEYFLIGNIAPDCGLPTGKHGEYNPPSSQTHFTVQDISNKDDCDYNFIYENYIKNEKDMDKKSFFTGYFVHLFTDCSFAQSIFPNIENRYGKFMEHPSLWKEVKKEINNIDRNHMKNYGSKSFEMFKTYSGFFENYPEWYKNDEISKQMKNITHFCSNTKTMQMEYNYITPKQIDHFIDYTIENLTIEIRKRNILL